MSDITDMPRLLVRAKTRITVLEAQVDDARHETRMARERAEQAEAALATAQDERDAALAERDAERQTRAMCDRTIEGFRAEVVSLGERLNITIAERDALRKDVAFHADCRPNRQQAEAAMADAKATNDKWADEVAAHRTTRESLTEARRVLLEVQALCVLREYFLPKLLADAIAAVLAQEKLS